MDINDKNFWDSLEKDLLKKMDEKDSKKPDTETIKEAAEQTMALLNSFENAGFSHSDAMRLVMTMLKGACANVKN